MFDCTLINDELDIYGHNKETLEIKELSFLPEYVQNNLEKFQHLIL
jgi:hypothetical protein